MLRNPDLESKLRDLWLHELGLTADDAPWTAKPLTAIEVYPTCREIDWSGAATSPLALQMLGSETEVIAIVGDRTDRAAEVAIAPTPLDFDKEHVDGTAGRACVVGPPIRSRKHVLGMG